MAGPQKRCLFCEKPVSVKKVEDGQMLLFRSCYCTGDGEYRIAENIYEAMNRMEPSEKRESFYLISGYIREQTDKGEAVELLAGNTAVITNSPLIPQTMEDKMEKLLLFLYRHTEEAGDEVQLDPLHSSFNLTYSPNLQEFIYILEHLKTEKLIGRVGATLSLTDKGVEEAQRIYESGHKKSKRCYFAVGDDPDLLASMQQIVFPRLEELGYEPFQADAPLERPDEQRDARQEIADSHVVIADFTSPRPDLYFEAGYAEGIGMEVLYSVRQDAVWGLTFGVMHAQTLVWETPEELADKLTVKLSARARQAAKAR